MVSGRSWSDRWRPPCTVGSYLIQRLRYNAMIEIDEVLSVLDTRLNRSRPAMGSKLDRTKIQTTRMLTVMLAVTWLRPCLYLSGQFWKCNYFLQFVLPSTRKRRFWPPKTELFWKRWRHRGHDLASVTVLVRPLIQKSGRINACRCCLCLCYRVLFLVWIWTLCSTIFMY